MRRLVALMVAVAMSLPGVLPTALAAESHVHVETQATAAGDAQHVSKLVIDDVDAPEAGRALDDRATVTSAEGVTWEIPVLWIDSELRLATTAGEGMTYLPALSFFVPEGIVVDGGEAGYDVTLSDSLTALFGGKEVVSVYDAATGITYILPATLRHYFDAANADAQRDARNQNPAEERVAPADQSTPDASVNPDVPATPVNPDVSDVPAVTVNPDEPADADVPTRSLVEIHCSQTARDAFTDEDLEWLLRLIIERLEPEAVELLLRSFPSFAAAADQGEIGREISLYVYYKKGDKDGVKAHEDVPPEALAYVGGGPVEQEDGTYLFGYLIGIDLDSLTRKDDDENPIIDATTGKYMLIRDGEEMETFKNTIVHELFHAFMDDYNRTGMQGAVNMADVVADDRGYLPTEEAEQRYLQTHFPQWFIEGTASAVENVFQFRRDYFDVLRTKNDGTLDEWFTNTEDKGWLLLNNYVNGKLNDERAYLNLDYTDGGKDWLGNDIDTTGSRYVSGYLACAYLAELVARKGGTSSITPVGNTYTVSSATIRSGLDTILARLHDGETLDQVIYDISPVDTNGNKLYTDTSDFERKFIKGGVDAEDHYKGDEESANFVMDYLNYLLYIDGAAGRTNKASGSILFDFERDFASPLTGEVTESEFFNIVDSNELIVSTVPDSQALATGGKSVSGAMQAASDLALVEDDDAAAPEDPMPISIEAWAASAVTSAVDAPEAPALTADTDKEGAVEEGGATSSDQVDESGLDTSEATANNAAGNTTDGVAADSDGGQEVTAIADVAAKVDEAAEEGAGQALVETPVAEAPVADLAPEAPATEAVEESSAE